MKVDPGSKHTGIVVARTDDAGVAHGLVSIQLDHRGRQIKKRMQQRAGYRRCRRSKNLRYRTPRFLNRHPEACTACGGNARHAKGYCRPCQRDRNFVDNGYRRHRLAPSLHHRVVTTSSWVERLRCWAPVKAVAVELVRFDTQLLQNPEITGVGYQQGTLAGYEAREYLLEKWGRKCAYCGAEGVFLQVEHVYPKGKGGTSRVSNLALACRACNSSKGDTTDLEGWCVTRFGKGSGEKVSARVAARAKTPLRDAAAVNSTRWVLWRALSETGLPVATGSGGQAKWNRSRFGLAKSHTLDAICVGETHGVGSLPATVLLVACAGRGQHQRTRPDKYGFTAGHYRLPGVPIEPSTGHKPRRKVRNGIQTGDLVRAAVPRGKHVGVHVGRAAVRSSGSVKVGTVDGINAKYCTVLQRSDGYSYKRKKEASLLPALTDGASGTL